MDNQADESPTRRFRVLYLSSRMKARMKQRTASTAIAAPSLLSTSGPVYLWDECFNSRPKLKYFWDSSNHERDSAASRVLLCWLSVDIRGECLVVGFSALPGVLVFIARSKPIGIFISPSPDPRRRMVVAFESLLGVRNWPFDAVVDCCGIEGDLNAVVTGVLGLSAVGIVAGLWRLGADPWLSSSSICLGRFSARCISADLEEEGRG